MKRIAAVLICCLAGFSGWSQSHSIEVWTGFETSADISKRISIDFQAEARWQQTSALLKQLIAETGIDYNLSKNVFIGASYKIADKYKKNGYYPEHTIAGVVGYKKKFDSFKFAVQSKLNVSKNTYIKDEASLRPTVIVKNKIKITYTGIHRIRPSAFVETYHVVAPGSHYHIATAKYSVNCSFEFRKNTSVDLGYMLRHEIDDKLLLSIFTLTLGKSF